MIRSPIPPEELLGQLVGTVALLAAPAEEQEDWAETNQYPAEEMALQLYDAVPAWFTRLRETAMIDAADELALLRLKDSLDEHQTELFLDGPFVTGAPEWQGVRELAWEAAESLRRPQNLKDLGST